MPQKFDICSPKVYQNIPKKGALTKKCNRMAFSYHVKLLKSIVGSAFGKGFSQVLFPTNKYYVSTTYYECSIVNPYAL